MRSRVLALTLAAVAAGSLAPAASAGYTGACSGPADVRCQGWSCEALDCFWYDCLVWVDPPVLDGDEVCVEP